MELHIRMKYYLLIAGYNESSDSGTGDWIGCFATEEEALEQIVENRHSPYESYYRYIVSGRERDWYYIVDLREWINESS